VSPAVYVRVGARAREEAERQARIAELLSRGLPRLGAAVVVAAKNAQPSDLGREPAMLTHTQRLLDHA
jgi:hypothetical protein